MSIIDRPQMLDKYIASTFELCKKGKSNFIKDGTGVDGIAAIHLGNSKNHYLAMASRLYLGKGKGYMPTQYVVSAPTHYVNDYWEDQEGNAVFDKLTKEEGLKRQLQYRPGLKSLGYDLKAEFARATELNIHFEQGELRLSKYSDDPVLLKFIQEHEQNVDAPNAKENNDPTRLRLFDFQKQVKEEKAAKSKISENFDTDLDAQIFVKKLREQTKDGYRYNEAMLNAVLNILDEGTGLDAGANAQKFEIVAKLSRKDGTAFMGLINTAMDNYRGAITMGDQLAILEFSANEVKMIKGTAKVPVLTFVNGSSRDNCVEELILHYLSGPKGQQDFADLNYLVELGKMAAVGKTKKGK